MGRSKSITHVDGVFANGIPCGIKPAKKDLAFIYVPKAVSSAGVFTQNRFISPTITHTRKCLKKNTLKAVIINSGNANAGTGKKGSENVKKIAKLAAQYLGLRPSEIGIASTGIIGVQQPMDKFTSGLPVLLENPLAKQGHEAAKAIVTTDTFEKEVYAEEKIGKKVIKVAGMTKGSGMIAPNMATTLTFLATNAELTPTTLQKCLTQAVSDSFNMLSIDRCNSTNDMVLIFSTGAHKFNIQSAPWMAVLTSKEFATSSAIDLASLVVTAF